MNKSKTVLSLLELDPRLQKMPPKKEPKEVSQTKSILTLRDDLKKAGFKIESASEGTLIITSKDGVDYLISRPKQWLD